MMPILRALALVGFSVVTSWSALSCSPVRAGDPLGSLEADAGIMVDQRSRSETAHGSAPESTRDVDPPHGDREMTSREGDESGVEGIPSWDEIDGWIEEQKLAAAREGAERRLEALDGENDPKELARTLVRIAQLDVGLHGYETAVRRLREAQWPEGDSSSRAIVGLVYAHTLRLYLSTYRWEIDQRERVVPEASVCCERPRRPEELDDVADRR